MDDWSAEISGGVRWREHRRRWQRRCLRCRGICQPRLVGPKFGRRKSESRFGWGRSIERNKPCMILLLGTVWMSILLCSRIQTKRGLQHHTPSVPLFNFFFFLEEEMFEFLFINWHFPKWELMNLNSTLFWLTLVNLNDYLAHL